MRVRAGVTWTLVICAVALAALCYRPFLFSPDSLPPAELTMQRLPAKAEAAVPAWLVDSRQCPLRRVTLRMYYFVRMDYGRRVLWYRDLLTCGHVVLPWGIGSEPETVRRRRCRQCYEEQLPVVSCQLPAKKEPARVRLPAALLGRKYA